LADLLEAVSPTIFTFNYGAGLPGRICYVVNTSVLSTSRIRMEMRQLRVKKLEDETLESLTTATSD